MIDLFFWKLSVGKRCSEMPISPEKLVNIDYISVSHAHYDHCDKNSIKLLAKQNAQAKILTFDVFDEPMSEPVKILNQMNNVNKIKGQLKSLDLEEVIELYS